MGDQLPLNSFGEQSLINALGDNSLALQKGEQARLNPFGDNSLAHQEGEQIPINSFSDNSVSYQRGKQSPFNSFGEQIPLNCLDDLTNKAIVSSLIIQSLDNEILRTSEQLDYLKGEIEYYKSRLWTGYITLDPLKILENLFGGGKVRDTKLTIVDLESKVAELENNEVQLQNQLIIEKQKIQNTIFTLITSLQENLETIELIKTRIDSTKLQFEVFSIGYVNGVGSTSEYLSYQDKIYSLESSLLKSINDGRSNFNEIKLLTGQDI